MTISIQVVGIFFGADLPLEGDQKVIDVMKTASDLARAGSIPNVKEFSYDVTQAPHASAISFTAVYTGEVKGRAIGLIYPPGEYFLAEDPSTKPAYSVWQYYVLNADKTPVQRGVKFLDDPAAVVPAGGTLIWRLVSILVGPNPRPRMMVKRQQQYS